MKRSSIGIIIFGIIFMGLSLYFFWASCELYAVYQTTGVAKVLDKVLAARIEETEKFISNKIPASHQETARQKLQTIKIIAERYKEDYVINKKVPGPLTLSAFFSVFVGLIFLYTAISILRLRKNVRTLISASFLGGFLWYCIFLWAALNSADFITQITNRFVAIIALASNRPAAPPAFNAFNLLWEPMAQRFNFTLLSGYLTLMAITSLFFSRKKIKDKFL